MRNQTKKKTKQLNDININIFKIKEAPIRSDQKYTHII